MIYPKMIMFDYGDTLIYDPDWDSLNGEIELFKYITNNPLGLTAEQINDYSKKLFAQLSKVREIGYEIHEYQFMHSLNKFLGLEHSLTYEQAERIFWNGASIGTAMPDAEKMLDYLNAHGIRTAVIGNSCFSEKALQERINRLLPRNSFEFIIASSEYGIRKPNPMLFDIALRKAGLNADDAWFCGDNPDADIYGATNAGIFPVWYNNLDVRSKYKGGTTITQPLCGHLHINEWDELIIALEGLE